MAAHRELEENVQREELDAFHRRKLWNICRGGGKSTTASTLAAHELVFGRAIHGMEPLVLAIAPSERQSRLLLRKVRAIFRKLGGVPPPLRDTQTELEVGDGMMAALPATENIRGSQNVTLLLWDEFSRMPDETVSATSPMVAERGRIVGLSTPAGMRGEFFKLFTEERRFPEWRRVTITGEQSERISKRKLEEERRRMTPVVFGAEYLCSFTDSDSVLFPTEMTRAAMTGEVEPLRAPWPRFL